MTEDPLFEKYDKDGRDKLEDVKRLTDELTDLISENISKALVDRFSDSASSVFAAKATQTLNSLTGKVVANLLWGHETQSFFDNQQHHYDLKSAKEHAEESWSESESKELQFYASKITDEQNPATALELHILTKSNLLEGKGTCVTVVDAQGKLLSEETYPGTDPAAGCIRVLLTKTPENSSKKGGILSRLKSRLMGQTTPHSGHFDIVRSDGSTQAVNSENQNCLFHAVIQATTKAPDHVVKEKAKELRSKVIEEICSHRGKYVNAVKIQNMFDQTKSCNKFKIGGARKQGEVLQIIDSKFVPAFLESMTEDPLFEKYDKDGRDKLEDVKRLTDELTDLISENISKALVDRFSDSASSVFAAKATQTINSLTGKVVANLLWWHETQSFFDNQQHHYDLKSAKEHAEESWSESESKELQFYASKITDEQNPATALELHILTKSNLLEGKGICVTVVDAQGKLLSEETYPGTDPAAGSIRVLLTKTPENSSKKGGILSRLKSRLMGQTTPHSGHFDIVRSDGSTQAVNSENQNCLFHAVIQATTKAPDHVVKEKAKELRSKVIEEICSHRGKYVNAVKIQNMFDQTKSCNKFKIGGARKQGEVLQIIDSKFVPAFLESMTEDPLFEKYDKDGRDKLEDVKRLTDELTDLISENISKALVDRFSDSASSVFAAKATQTINSLTGKVVANLLWWHETQSFFDNQQHHYDLKSAKEHAEESWSESESKELQFYASKITDEQNPATALELHILTKSNLLEGKGICVTVVDAQGKLLSEETYPGTDPAAGSIRVLLTKTPENSSKKGGILSRLKSRLMGQTTPHSGHFDIVRSDGSTQAVNSENQNCLFHAVIQATTKAPDHVVKEKAKELRSKVIEEICSHRGKYVNAVKIQNMFDQTKSCNKFKIGGARKQGEVLQVH
ncbi:hypothetical protein MHYP_G00016520 [Metynnis hypsauchen]